MQSASKKKQAVPHNMDNHIKLTQQMQNAFYQKKQVNAQAPVARQLVKSTRTGPPLSSAPKSTVTKA